MRLPLLLIGALPLCIFSTAKSPRSYQTPRAEPLLAVPIGTILISATAQPPVGYLRCDGSEVLRATYPSLFARIGTTYGPGDGFTTFRLPDLRVRFPLGLGDGPTGTGSVLGEFGGLVDHTHALPPHSHSLPGHGHSFDLMAVAAGDHAHTASGSTDSAGQHAHSVSGATTVDGMHNHNVTKLANNNCGEFANENESQRLASVKNCNGSYTMGFSCSDAGDHNHGVTGTAAPDGMHSHVVSLSTSPSGAHVHTVSGTVGGAAQNGDGTLTSGTGGDGPSGSENPPYLTLNYFIKT